MLQEALVILIVLSEDREEIKIGVLGHVDVAGPEGAKLHKLGFSATCVNREHPSNDVFEEALEVVHINFALIVNVGQAQN